MLKHYFNYKIQTKDFINNLESVVSELKGKKVLICGNSAGFNILDKKYELTQQLNPIGFVEVEENKLIKKSVKVKRYTIKQAAELDFDYILVTSEDSDAVFNKLMNEVDEKKMNLKYLFEENLRDAGVNLNFLMKHKFDKNLKKLSKKLKNKRVLFYGAGLFFQLINEYFDLSSINAIGIADKKLCQLSKYKEVCGYKLYSPEEIKELKPDYVIVSTRRVLTIYSELCSDYLKNTNIKIIPLVSRSFWSIIFEG